MLAHITKNNLHLFRVVSREDGGGVNTMYQLNLADNVESDVAYKSITMLKIECSIYT